MKEHKLKRQRWAKGTWMKITSVATLLALMNQRGMSYGRLARYSGCSKGFISHLVSGRRRSCTPDLAERIAEALDVPLDVLFVAETSITDGRSTHARRTNGHAA